MRSLILLGATPTFVQVVFEDSDVSLKLYVHPHYWTSRTTHHDRAIYLDCTHPPADNNERLPLLVDGQVLRVEFRLYAFVRGSRTLICFRRNGNVDTLGPSTPEENRSFSTIWFRVLKLEASKSKMFHSKN